MIASRGVVPRLVPFSRNASCLTVTVCRQSVENNGIKTPTDLDRLKAAFAETDQKAAALKENFKRCRQLNDVYSDIAKTYYDISSGDFISRLVDEERKRQAHEANKTKKKMS